MATPATAPVAAAGIAIAISRTLLIARASLSPMFCILTTPLKCLRTPGHHLGQGTPGKGLCAYQAEEQEKKRNWIGRTLRMLQCDQCPQDGKDE